MTLGSISSRVVIPIRAREGNKGCTHPEHHCVELRKGARPVLGLDKLGSLDTGVEPLVRRRLCLQREGQADLPLLICKQRLFVEQAVAAVWWRVEERRTYV